MTNIKRKRYQGNRLDISVWFHIQSYKSGQGLTAVIGTRFDSDFSPNPATTRNLQITDHLLPSFEKLAVLISLMQPTSLPKIMLNVCVWVSYRILHVIHYVELFGVVGYDLYPRPQILFETSRYKK